ncbi:MAG: chemotaxis protein CheA [bacterium]
MIDIDQDSIDIFLAEAIELLIYMEKALLQLEKNPKDTDSLNHVFRTFHTIKGSGAMFGLELISEFAHQVENILDKVRQGELPVSRQLIDLILAYRDCLHNMFQETQNRFHHNTGYLQIESGTVSKEKISPALPDQKARKPRHKKQTNTLRVTGAKLGFLINVVGELAAVQSWLLKTAKEFESQDLMRPVKEMQRLTAKLSDSVMNIWMMPIQSTFIRFERLVRDLSINLEKQVKLELRGGETELDKTVIEKLNEPLIHLLRNAVGHGIESPAERAEKGKHPVARIVLSASYIDGFVHIIIQDDGAGIDEEAVFLKAVNLAVVNEQENLSQKEKLHLIFHPGLSTAGEVSFVSGRGVGMDVVKSEIMNLNGNVDIESQPGEGTKVVIKLPLKDQGCRYPLKTQ